MIPAADPGPRTWRAAVLMTCYDDGETLRESVASVRRQGPGFELVVVDDGSVDRFTLEVMSELRTEGIRVLRQANQGQSAASMTALRSTSAPYVIRFDSDDILEDGALGALCDALDQAPNAAAAWGDAETFGLTDFRIPSAPELDPWLVTHTNCIPVGGTLFRRSVLEAAGGWELRSGFEDWDLWMTLAEGDAWGVYVPRVVLKYRRDHGGQLAGNLPRTTQYFEEIKARHARLFAQHGRNLRRSRAPLSLKLAVSLVELIPGLSRLRRIQLCQLFTHLLWNGGWGSTSPMLRQALAIRLPAGLGQIRQPSGGQM